MIGFVANKKGGKTQHQRWVARGRYFVSGLLLWAVLTLVVLPLWYGQDLSLPPLEVPAEKYPFLYMALVTNPIIWEFVMGAVVAVLIQRYREPLLELSDKTVKGFVWFACTLFVVTFFAFDNKMEPLSCGLPSALLVGALVLGDLKGVWKIPGWMEKLGDSSYGIYLLHPIVIHFYRPLQESGVGIEWLAMVLVVGTTIVCAWLVHVLFERPILRFGKSLIPARPSPA